MFLTGLLRFNTVVLCDHHYIKTYIKFNDDHII